MAINKNFVVKNGLEIATDLIFADSLSNKAGIGTTNPTHKLDVNGDTGVSGDFRVTGISTVGGVFDVGIAGTALRVDNGTGRVGVNTASPEYNLEVIGDAGISSHFNVGGITTSSILHVTGLTSSVHLNVTGVTTIADARINAGFTTVTYSEAQLLNVTGVATVGGAVTMSSTGIDVNNIDVEALTGRDIDITGNIDATTYTGDGSAISGIVTTLVAGENISISGGTGTVTITGLAKTDNINADTLVVTGITTLGILTGATSIGADEVYALQYFGDGSNLTGIDTSGNFQGKTIVCENVSASSPGVGTFGSVVINNPAGRITATEFYGDGANLTNTGASLSAVSGTERVVLTSLTSGTMTSASTDSALSFNVNDSNFSFGSTGKIVLNAASGIATFTGAVTVKENINGLKAVSGAGTDDSPVLRVYSDTENKYTANINADGSASFAEGTVEIGKNTGITIDDGVIDLYAASTNTNSKLIKFSSDVGSGTKNEVAFVRASGDAEFRGGIIAGDVSTDNSTPYFRWRESDSVTIYDPSSSSGSSALKIFSNVGGSLKQQTTLTAGGGGTFEGGISARTQDAERALTIHSSSSSQNEAFKINTNGGAQKVLINHDGTSQFYGKMEVGQSTGQFVNLRPGQTGTADVLWIQNTNNSRPFLVGADGSAAYAGTVKGSYSPGGNAGGVFLMVNPSDLTEDAGGLYQKDGGVSNLTLRNGWDTSATINLDGATGNATFGGTINATLNGTATNATNVRIDSEESSGSTHLISFTASAGGSNYRVKADSSLSYNPSTNTLTVANLSGNASTATNATNAGTLDGYDSSQSATGSTVAVRDGSGHLTVNYLYSSYVNMTNGRTTRSSDDTFYSSTDDFIRKTDATGMRASLNVPTRTGGNASGTWGISISGNAATATNADKLDNIDSSQFLRSDAADQKTSGDLTLYNNISLNFGSNTPNVFQMFCDGSDMYMDLESGINNLYIRDGSTTRFTFNDNGDLTATGDVVTNSDIKLKKNIETLENPIEKVKQLRGVRYDRVDMEKDNCIGVIAQEVEEVYPEFVSESEDGIKSVDYSKMVAVLIETVKEQQKQIDELKSIINK